MFQKKANKYKQNENQTQQEFNINTERNQEMNIVIE